MAGADADVDAGLARRWVRILMACLVVVGVVGGSVPLLDSVLGVDCYYSHSIILLSYSFPIIGYDVAWILKTPYTFLLVRLSIPCVSWPAAEGRGNRDEKRKCRGRSWGVLSLSFIMLWWCMV